MDAQTHSVLEAAATEVPVIDTPRFRWRVRDCVFCSWRELREEYSASEMWQLLIQGRFTKAVPLALPEERTPLAIVRPDVPNE